MVWGRPIASKAKSKPSPPVTVAFAPSSSSGLTACVAPNRWASSSLESTRSTATISDAPATRAPCIAEMPTPPQPNTTTDDPGVTLAVLTAAPTPVMTPQPTSEAISRGTSGSIFTAPWWGTIISSAHVPAPANPNIGDPSWLKCMAPMAPNWMLTQRLGCLRSTQYLHTPHGALQAMMTWSPGATDVTPSPTSLITPAPSWPGTNGAGCGIVPFMPDTSEWHTPVAWTLTLTSPGPTGPSSMSSRISSFSSPVVRSTAARIAVFPS